MINLIYEKTKNKTYEECGYEFDKDKKILNQICNYGNIQEVRIDIYTEKPYMLFGRIIENKVIMSNIDNQITFSKRDRHKTVVLDLLFNEIENCFVKKYSDKRYSILFTICNISYEMLVII